MRVFKYRGGDENIFKRDLESLEKDTFWAPTRNALNDPCEGLVFCEGLLRQIDIAASILGNGSEDVTASVKSLKKALSQVIDKTERVGIYSLSKSCTDELLWAHYANSHEGFCIEYELDKLVHFGRTDYHNFDVIYSDHPPQLNINDMYKIDDNIGFIQKLIGIKSKRWAYEKEIRVITSEAGSQSYDFRAVKAIYFGFRMPEERKHEIMRKLSGRGIKYYQIHLKVNSYKFYSQEIDDIYPTDTKYLYSIAPVAEYAIDPSTLEKKWAEFSSYLNKMAEIVRREPYCNEVLMVEVSPDKSQPGKPVFFGQYQRSKYRYEKMYLTQEQIDERYSRITDLESQLGDV